MMSRDQSAQLPTTQGRGARRMRSCGWAARTALAFGVLLAGLGPGARSARGAEPAAAGASEPSEEEKAAARQLFTQGLALEKKNQWDEALASFDKVAKVIMTAQVRYHVALCHANLGHMVEAINGFEVAIQEAKIAGDKGRDVAENAPKRLEELRARVGYVRIKVRGKIRTSRILIDGRPLAVALVDSEIPLNPGSHALEVETAGSVADRHTLQIEKQTTAEIELRIDDPEPPAAPAAGPRTESPATPPPPAADEGNPQVAAYVVGATGLLLLGGGGLFWGLRESTISDVRGHCDGNDGNCDPSFKSQADLGQTYTTLGRVLFPVGGTALAAGVVLWFVLAPSDSAAPAATESEPAASSESAVRVLPTLGGVEVLGSF